MGFKCKGNSHVTEGEGLGYDQGLSAVLTYCGHLRIHQMPRQGAWETCWVLGVMRSLSQAGWTAAPYHPEFLTPGAQSPWTCLVPLGRRFLLIRSLVNKH